MNQSQFSILNNDKKALRISKHTKFMHATILTWDKSWFLWASFCLIFIYKQRKLVLAFGCP